MNRQLVERERGRRVPFQVLDVPLLAPRLTGRTVQVLKRRRENRLEQRPRPVAERFDEPDVELPQGLDVLHGYASSNERPAGRPTVEFLALAGCGHDGESRTSDRPREARTRRPR